MKITCNWQKSKKGNAIIEGSTLVISAPGAHHISGGVYKNGSPVLAIFGYGSRASIKLSRKGKSLKGLCVLKVRAFDVKYRGFGIDDAFEVI